MPVSSVSKPTDIPSLPSKSSRRCRGQSFPFARAATTTSSSCERSMRTASISPTRVLAITACRLHDSWRLGRARLASCSGRSSEMMRRSVWLILLFAAQPCFGQTLDELKQRLTEREAEVQQLREQIQTLEQQTVAAIPTSPAAASTTPADEFEDIDRALERALVREGGLLLSPGAAEAELNFSYSHASRES